jgi:hypothetical protein
MCRDPRDPLLVILEKGARGVVGDDWLARLDKLFIDNLGKFRKYDHKSVQDLMRALRNKVRIFAVQNLSHRAYLELPLRNTTIKICLTL